MSKSSTPRKTAASGNPYATPSIHITATRVAPSPASTVISSAGDLRTGR